MIEIRFAEDSEVLAIHDFLCLVALPVLLGEVDAGETIAEIGHVVNNEVALIATIDGEFVGTLGVRRFKWWYSKTTHFFTDRWFFTYPALKGRGVGARLLAEAAAVSSEIGDDLVINGHMRRRAIAVGRGILFTKPVVIPPEQVPMMTAEAWQKVEDDVLWHDTDRAERH